MNDKITIENVGPIEGEFPIDLDGPGLYELTGSKGQGKSTILNSLEMLSGRKVSLTVNQHAPEGKVTGFGVVSSVGTTKRKAAGNREVDVIDVERFNLVDLIDPQGKTPSSRDNNRIKALASLMGVELAPEDFYELVGGKEAFEELRVAKSDDVILYANRIKAKLDAEAKTHEDISKQEEARAEALKPKFEGHDIELSDLSEDDAVRRVEEASADRAKLRERAEAAEKSAAKRSDLERQLFDLRDRQVTRADDVAAELSGLLEDYEFQEHRLARLEGELAETKREIEKLIDQISGKRLLKSEAESHEKQLAKLETELATSAPEAPSEADIEAADKAFEDAQQSFSRHREAREAARARNQASDHLDRAVEERIKADKLRNDAKGVFDILAARLPTEHIRVTSISDNARLVVDHERGPNTLFDQDNGLSDGERVLFALRELLPHLKSPGLFAIPQRTYQDLPPADREMLARYAEEHGLFLFGAQVTDGDLSVDKVHEAGEV